MIDMQRTRHQYRPLCKPTGHPVALHGRASLPSLTGKGINRSKKYRKVSVKADLSQSLYTASEGLNDIVLASLDTGGVEWYIYPIVTLAGLATSLSPCVLSVLPLTIGYIGGYTNTGDGIDGNKSLSANAIGFGLGLASTLAILGVLSTSLGKTYGQIGPGLPIVVSVFAIIMGLNLLEVIQLSFPSAMQDFDPRKLGLPPFLTSFLAGFAFAFVSSPCSTPVLATPLGYVSTLDSPVKGGFLLLCYAFGYVAPLQVAATATESIKKIPQMRAYSSWINPLSGVLLVAGGTYFFLENVPSFV